MVVTSSESTFHPLYQLFPEGKTRNDEIKHPGKWPKKKLYFKPPNIVINGEN